MYLERKGNKKNRKGWIEVVCGSMFSGKTEELIRRLRRAQYANQQVQIFKPTVDSKLNAIMFVRSPSLTISVVSSVFSSAPTYVKRFLIS